MPQFIRKNAPKTKQPSRCTPRDSRQLRHGQQDSVCAEQMSLSLNTSCCDIFSEDVVSEPSCKDNSMRLNKALATAGVCSRRKADTLIATGRVMVNDSIVTDLGSKVQPADTISVDGRPLQRAVATLYVMVHKPVHMVCTVQDPQGRATVMELLPHSCADCRLYPVGRLDYFSEGLLLLTNDGALAQRLMHPRYHLPKVYEVVVRENVSDAALQTMRHGMQLQEGDKLSPVGVRRLSAANAPQTQLRMMLHQGVNRQIRRMCRDLGLTILSLRRIAQGPLELGSLPLGKSRMLTQAECIALRKAVGLYK